MTHWLIKTFIRDHKNTGDARIRTAYGVLASLTGIICNIVLFCAKIVIGTITNSISITADAFNNLSDAGSSIISLIGIRLAVKPADREHPFGHGRIEYITSFIIAFIIIIIGATLLQNSITKIITPEETGFSWILISVLGGSVLIKLWLWLFNKKVGKLINSIVMKSTSADSLNDVAVTSATILSAVVSRYMEVNIDGYAGIAISAYVIYSGLMIAKDTLMPLLGSTVDKNVYSGIMGIIESCDGIIGSHDLITHNYGPTYIMGSIHAEVSNELTSEEVHDVVDMIEKEVRMKTGVNLVIHADPVAVNDRDTWEKKKTVAKIVKDIEPKAAIHDFRVSGSSGGNGGNASNGGNRKNGSTPAISFDLVVP